MIPRSTFPFSLPPSPPPCHDSIPSLARDEANLVAVAVWMDAARLPPFLVGSVDHVQNVTKMEAQSLAQEATVLGLVIVKKRPASEEVQQEGVSREPRLRGGGKT